MNDGEATACAQALAEGLTEALRDAEAEGVALGRLDHARVLELTVRRERFNTESADLTRRLREAIGQRRAVEVPGLEERLRQINGLALALAQRDAQTRALAERALRFTQGYVNALRPKPQTYDRRGKFMTGRVEALGSTVSHHT